VPCIKEAFKELEKIADIIVIEGAGSPAEINLKENDIVNMGMAEIVDAPVLLVGDIDRGGVFAQLLGTIMLLEDKEKDRIKGLIINKFRGDKTILDPGIDMLEEKGKIPVAGVLPYMNVRLEDEDSLSDRFDNKKHGVIDIAIVRFPRISNFTDFNVFEQNSSVSLRYVTTPEELESADMIFLPGSKNTIGDLKWMRQNGIEAMVKKCAEKVPVFGICGGFQMLGKSIDDPDKIEEGGSINGLGLLDIETVLKSEKTRTQKTGYLNEIGGVLEGLSGLEFEGYEIHVGETSGNASDIICSGNIYGTYIHGIFDKKEIAETVIKTLADKKGVEISDDNLMDYASFKEKEYDRMADILREHLDMEKIYGMLNEAEIK
ncbi:MAG: cobyric acid synthase, partial [Lachnospiraceae bacterium]|nr:cobyric acid synthase [Lachnospiraceae bacterium]